MGGKLLKEGQLLMSRLVVQVEIANYKKNVFGVSSYD
jgi:hypothetical protein